MKKSLTALAVAALMATSVVMISTRVEARSNAWGAGAAMVAAARAADIQPVHYYRRYYRYPRRYYYYRPYYRRYYYAPRYGYRYYRLYRYYRPHRYYYPSYYGYRRPSFGVYFYYGW